MSCITNAAPGPTRRGRSLSDDDREYLKLLVGRRTSEATDDAAFYEAQRGELREDRKLKSAWDRFVFGRPIDATDFLTGLSASLEPLFNTTGWRRSCAGSRCCHGVGSSSGPSLGWRARGASRATTSACPRPVRQ
jgi:hypothetical protein